MGRPSRKRPRPPPPSLAETSRFDALKLRLLLPSAVSRFEECGSIQSLVTKGVNPKSTSCNPGGETTMPTASVQQVWGALDQADVTATTAALGLGVGVPIDVDEAGIAWLLHTPRQSSTHRDRHEGLSETDCSQCGDSSLGPQQQRQAASDASTSTAGADSARTTSLDPPCPEDHPRSANDCTSSGRRAHGEEDVRRSFWVCDEAVRAELSRVKDEFDDIPPAVFKRARSACNPAEALGSGLFLNRSAMKLANIDAVAGLSASCSGPLPVGRTTGQQGVDGVVGETRRVGGGNSRIHEFSHASATAAAVFGSRDGKWEQQQRQQQQGEEKTEQQEEEEEEGEKQQQQQQQQEKGQETPRGGEQPRRGSAPPPFLFADLCGGPGGFSEYLLLRRRQLGLPARGWGISLRGGGAKPNPGGRRTTANDCGGGSTASRDELATSHDVHAEHGGAWSESGAATARHDHCSEDPCAWRLSHLSPWCDVCTETIEPAEATVFCGAGVDPSAVSTNVEIKPERRASEEISHSDSLNTLVVGEDLETNACPLARDASVCGDEVGGLGVRLGERDGGENSGLDAVASDNDGGVCEPDMRQSYLTTPVATAPPATDTAATTPPPPFPPSTTAAAATTTAADTTVTSTTVPPVLEMRINYGPAGTGDLADEKNMYGFVDAVLASTEGRGLDLVVADGGIEAARDSGEQECLMTPLVHSEVRVWSPYEGWGWKGRGEGGHKMK